MKKFKWLGLTSLLVAIPLLGFVGLAHAQSFKRVVEKGEVVNSSIYATGKTIDISGTVNGDVYCAGADITIDGTINGDVLCAGQDVTVGGTVNGNIRVAGMNVDVSAVGIRAMTAAAQTLSLDADSRVNTDATVLGASLNLKGVIGRDLTASGQKLTLNGDIGRDVKAQVGTMLVKNNASIGGVLNYTSEQKAEIDSRAIIAKGTHYTKPADKKSDKNQGWNFNPMFYFFVLASLSLVSLIAVLLIPKAVVSASEVARKRWALSLGVGFLASIAIPVGLVLLAMTLVGLPLLLAVLLVWGLLSFASGPVVAFMVGRLILRKYATNTVAVMAFGSLVLVTAYFLPVLGFFLLIAVYLIGTGAILIGIKNSLPTPDYKM
jgi:hypothetical protein